MDFDDLAETAKRVGKVAAIGLPLVGVAAAATAAGVAVGIGALLRRRWADRHSWNLSGRVVLITGGSRGLGFAIAEECLRQGARVALCARSADELATARERLSALGEVVASVCDLRDREQIQRMVLEIKQQCGHIDVLINNAGVMQVGPWEEMTDADFEDALHTHLWGPLWTTRAVLPDMIARHDGRILNISSIGGLVAVPHMLPYSASKFALVGLSQGWRAELLRHGVKMTCVCPWLTRTGSQEQAFFKGRNEREFLWFAASGATALTALSAQRAARRIVTACRRGEAQVVLSIPGKLVALAHGIAPGAVIDALAAVNRILPEPTGDGHVAKKGAESYSGATQFLRPSIRATGRRNNQPVGSITPPATT
jgi:NAD(P)-dependent dehydrogenase (short-subunit alcohol dehydrogenase family)